MDIFEQVQQVVSDIPQTPREFLITTLGENWQYATIAHYRMRTDSDIRCYSAVLNMQCPDCGERTFGMAMFTQGEQGGYRLLHPEQVEVVW